MSALVLIEHRDGKLLPANARVMAAARELSEQVDVLVVGDQVGEVASQAACLAGVNQVWVADDGRYAGNIAESIASVVAARAEGYRHVLTAASSVGKDILPRAAGLAGVSQISDIVEIVDASTFKRPIYAGSLIATVRTHGALTLLTVRTTAFEPVGEQAPAAITPIEVIGYTLGVRVVAEQRDDSSRPDLTTARIVVSGGRGVGSAENFALIEALADRLGAAVGASRAAVDAGYIANDHQVGQTGKIVAPDLYIAVGISGAVQHLAGMQGARTVVAINQDDEAPMLEHADYALVGDLFELVPELTARL